MTHSKVKPFLTYLDQQDIVRLKKFAKTKKKTMAHIVREAIGMRLAEGNQYIAGFNAGIQSSIDLVHLNKASQMRFPSGKSFAELIEDDLNSARMVEASNEKTG